MPHRIRIALPNFDDVANYGDSLFPILTARQLQSRIPAAEFTYTSPTGIGLTPSVRHDAVRYEDYDAVVLAGGEIVHRNDSMYHEIYERLGRTAIEKPSDVVFGWAAARGPYKAWFGLGVPVMDADATQATREAIHSLDLVTVRSTASANRLRAIGSTPAIMPDIGWLFPTLLTDRTPHPAAPTQPYVTFHMFPQAVPPDFNLLIQPLRQLEQRGLRVLLTPLTTCWGDEGPLQRLGQLGGFQVLDYKLPPLEKLQVLSGSSMYIGQSMHGFVTTLASGTPAGLCYPVRDDKFSALLDETGLQDLRVDGWERLTELCGRVAAVDPSRVANVRDRAVAGVTRAFDQLAGAIQAHVRAGSMPG